MMTRAEAAAWLAERNDFLLITHHRPDGDTLGSAALLCRGLRSLGKNAFIMTNSGVTSRYEDIMEGLCVAMMSPATVVCVDVPSPEMLPEGCVPEKVALRIDHHGSATSFTPYEIVEPEAAAAGEIVYGILQEMGVALDAEMADALFTAISTDTGCFRFNNTTAETLEIAAACVRAGARRYELTQRYFEVQSLAKVRLHGYLAENMQVFAGGRFALCCLPRQVEEELGITEDDMDNISGFPRTIEGIEMAATIREIRSGCKVSVRANPDYDASAVCAQFGGGGHKGAAGGNLQVTLAEAAEIVKKAMELQA